MILQGGEGKEEEEDSGANGEGTWIPPSLPEVTNELATSTSPDAAEAFSTLFQGPTATIIPDFPVHTLDMMSNFAHSIYMVNIFSFLKILSIEIFK